jgi:hypothetical protein
MESTILLLKSCVALKELKGKPMNKENLLQMIEDLNIKTEKEFKRGLPREMVMCTSKDITEDLSDQNHLYCEDYRLSLGGAGHVFWSVDVKKRKDVNFIEAEELNDILEAIAGGLDLERPVKVCGPAAHAQRWRIYDSPMYKRGREWRMSRM